MDRRRRTLWIIGAFLFLISFSILLMFGNSYTYEIDAPEGSDISEYVITTETNGKIFSVKDAKISNGKLKITFQSESRG
ncbi:MAG: hypothetical protein J5653_04275, partial [Clostridiales bacterium]|nr:hypothetical protein [Clostridiales bacterium]